MSALKQQADILKDKVRFEGETTRAHDKQQNAVLEGSR
jgi:hypothetical protein